MSVEGYFVSHKYFNITSGNPRSNVATSDYGPLVLDFHAHAATGCRLKKLLQRLTTGKIEKSISKCHAIYRVEAVGLKNSNYT